MLVWMTVRYAHRRTRRGVGGGGHPPRLENFQDKLCFQGKCYSCSKILDDKNYCSTVKKSRVTVSQGNRKCSNILNDKKYIFNTVNSEHPLLFRASASRSKILKKYIHYSEKFQGNSVFQGKRELLKNPE